MMTIKKILLKDFPKLEPVIDRVEMTNAQIKSADLIDMEAIEGRGGIALQLDLSWKGAGTTLYFGPEEIQQVLRIAGVTRLSRLTRKHLRLEYMAQASWTAFSRLWHLTDDLNLLVKYDEQGLERYARGERV